MNTSERAYPFVALALAAAACTLGCGTASVDDPTDESVADRAEPLTRTLSGRADLKAYTDEPGFYQALPDAAGYYNCPDGHFLAGFDQSSATHAIACYGPTTIRHFPVTSTYNESILNLGGPFAYDQPSPLYSPAPSAPFGQRVLTFSSGGFVATGVNFTKGTLKGQLVDTSGGVFVRAKSNSVSTFTYQGVTREMHVCPAGTPMIHGANVLWPTAYPHYNVVNGIQPLAFQDFSCRGL